MTSRESSGKLVLHQAGARLHNAHIYQMKTDREQLQEIAFQASDGTYFITDNYADELLKIYGYCGFPTVIREFVKAADWLSANPKRRKTKQAMSRFLTVWLFRYWNFTRGRLFKKKQ